MTLPFSIDSDIYTVLEIVLQHPLLLFSIEQITLYVWLTSDPQSCWINKKETKPTEFQPISKIILTAYLLALQFR